MKQEDIKEILNRLGTEDVPADARQIARKISRDFSETFMRPKRHILMEYIMKSQITKLAAAAVIIIAVLVCINQFGGSTNKAGIAFAGTLETMKRMSWIHVITESDTPRGRETGESWTCFDPFIWASKGTRVSTVYANYNEGKEYLYSPRDPYSNKISIIPVEDEYKHPELPIDMIERILENWTNQDAEISRENSTLDGKRVEIIHINSPIRKTTLYRDVERNLLIRMDDIITTSNTEPKRTSTKIGSKVSTKAPPKDLPKANLTLKRKYKRFFDYPDQGPADIYDLGAPRDAEIDNYCPTGALADIFAEVRQRIRKAYDGYVAIVLESRLDDGKPVPPKITMMRPRNPADSPFVWVGIKSMAWFHPRCFALNWNSYDTNYEMLPADTQHEALVGFRAAQIQKSSIKRKRIDEYWLDPKRDYIVMEHVRYEDHMNRYWDSTKRTITLATKQTPDGQWYPGYISYEWDYTDDTGRHKQQIEKRIILDTELTFPEGSFEADYIFNGE
ncbi:MAG: hypothetical protein GWN67_09320 [Phycisphaerae bacterium]|nr:hypothetical protein [Phycisphaerae bacterium]NIP52302.1 hypothetical protein [Phycisphaerae bacterium]NIS51265.1 hypothetical protein [Phycisphaerae bacterium]NIU09777.1 hypothetical protein [Phycisphaerae bacterium]NIU56565.1 hypothetical protein [Phycisphaerae bacterium]